MIVTKKYNQSNIWTPPLCKSLYRYFTHLIFHLSKICLHKTPPDTPGIVPKLLISLLRGFVCALAQSVTVQLRLCLKLSLSSQVNN